MPPVAIEPRTGSAPVFANRQRLPYLDNIRILLTALVIYHHTVIAYGGLGGWFYVTPEVVTGWPRVLMTTTLAIDQAFFMSLFFFISAYLMPASLERKGVARFIGDRLVRLGIPLVAMICVISPSLVYLIETTRHGNTTPYPQFVIGFLPHYATPAHMWFVLMLLIFEGVYVLYRLLPLGLSPKLKDGFPRPKWIITFTLACGLVAWMLRLEFPVGWSWFGLQLGFFSLYIGMYAAGILAYRKQWLSKLTLGRARPYATSALIAIPLIVPAIWQIYASPSASGDSAGGANLMALAYALWEPVVCVGISLSLLAAFQRYLNRATPFFQRMAADSYAVYFIHPVLVVGYTFLFESVALAPLPKFGLVCVLSIVSCFAVADLLRRVPGVKRVL